MDEFWVRWVDVAKGWTVLPLPRPRPLVLVVGFEGDGPGAASFDVDPRPRPPRVPLVEGALAPPLLPLPLLAGG